MRNFFAISAGLIGLTMLACQAGPLVTYTWTGTSPDLSDSTNWTPTGIPTSIDAASFNASAVTKVLLTPGGMDFSVKSATFSSAAFSFASAGPGDVINLGDGDIGATTVSSAASVDFNDQPIMLNNSMTWAVSGGSSLTSAGVIDTTGGDPLAGFALTISFGAAQANNFTQFQDFAFGTTGSLTIANWGGTAWHFGGVNNQLRFGTDPSAYLGNISFTGYAAGAVAQAAGSYWEVVPVPEPATITLVLAGLACIAGRRRRA